MSHLVLTYGTLMSGRSNHGRLARAKLIGRAVTALNYALYDCGAFPGMVMEQSPYPVVGELYEIDDATLASCDRLEGHPHFYKRERIEVLIPSPIPMGMDAWAYFIQPPHYKGWKLLDSGVWQPRPRTPLSISAVAEAGV